MGDVDEYELWVSEDDEEGNNGADPEDPTYFVLQLERVGQAGGFHTRNKAEEKQRKTVSSFDSGPKKKPAFHVSCTAQAIVHGTLDQVSNTPATLLIYDLCFFSYRGARIKGAEISFDFQPKKGSTSGGGPVVKAISPYARHTMMETTQNEGRSMGASLGIGGGLVARTEMKLEQQASTEKTTTHAAEIIGSTPSDDWGNHFQSRWSVKENDSQRNGIMALLRTCILLTRDDDAEFECIPYIEVEPDLKSRLRYLASSRGPDDPIIFDPEYEPYNVLKDDIEIDRWNLGAHKLNNLWDCTFYSTFEEAVKTSRT